VIPKVSQEQDTVSAGSRDLEGVQVNSKRKPSAGRRYMWPTRV
jgi:hypothetical protein